VSGLDPTLEPERRDPTLEPERLRRIEVINGVCGRRRWSVDEKARILEQTLVPGAVVSEVARRHGLSPQQLFGWRREARRMNEAFAAPTAFVPAVLEGSASAAVVEPRPGRRRRRRGSSRTSASGAIEIEIDGVAVWVGPGASPKSIEAVIRALKGGP
jgi:transposase